MPNSNTLDQISNYVAEVATTDIASKFLALFDRYDLNKFVTYGHLPGRSYFVASDLSLAKGLNKDDFRSHHVHHLTACEKGTRLNVEVFNHAFLPGRYFKLSGTPLKDFKAVYLEQNNIRLGRASSLWVHDWKAAYAYLSQGTSEASRNLTKELLGLSADAVTSVITQSSVEQLATESELLQQIWFLIGLGKQPFWSIECEVPDVTEAKERSRRYDLIRIQGIRNRLKLIIIYELKRNKITLQDILHKVEQCRYLELAEAHYKTSNIKLIFVSAFGATPEAHAFVKTRPDLEIIYLHQLVLPLLSKALEKHALNPFFIKNNVVKSECSKLFNATLQGLNLDLKQNSILTDLLIA